MENEAVKTDESPVTLLASEPDGTVNPVNLPQVSLLDDENRLYPFIVNDDSIYLGKRKEYMFTGLVKDGPILLIAHIHGEDQIIPNKYHKYIGFILEGDARKIFHIANPVKATLTEETSEYLIDDLSSLSYVGGDKYTYTIYVKSGVGETLEASNMITLYAEKNDYVYTFDSIFSRWAEGNEPANIDGFKQPAPKQKVIDAPKPGMFDTLMKKW
jgi:hypothetical protein